MTSTVDERAITGTEKAYTYARSGLARSGATRSNYLPPYTTVELITRYGDGAIKSRTDLVPYIRHGSLQVSQALNDEPDTCSFQIVPTAPREAVPNVGNEIIVGWSAGHLVFQGYALVVQFDRRPMNESPWVSIQCQDAMWRFDARMVTCGFPSQSATASIQYLVTWFVNNPLQVSQIDFTTTHVQPNMPTLPAFDVVNMRPSTVMRRLTATVEGAFYLDGPNLHAWAGSLSEPNQPPPATLTNDLPTLKAFRVSHDATQLRKRVLVEGRRTSTLIPYPAIPDAGAHEFLGLPVGDASIFAPATGPEARYLARIGSQWMFVNDPQVVTPTGGNPPQSTVAIAYVPEPSGNYLTVAPMTPLPPDRGWIRVSGQFSRYAGYTVVSGNNIRLNLPSRAGGFPYGLFTVPFAVGTTVDWVDSVMSIHPHGLAWDWFDPTINTAGDLSLRAAPVDTPVVTLGEADRSPVDNTRNIVWPPIEGFVQDGRYSYEGVNARANTDLDSFEHPLVSVEWETEDPNAQPGRVQAINLTGSSVIDPLVTSVTITRVDLTFPLRTLPPRRRCTGGDVKPSKFLDLVITDES